MESKPRRMTKEELEGGINPLPIEQRLWIYKKALATYRNCLDDGVFIGLCPIITTNLIDLIRDADRGNLWYKFLPEWYKVWEDLGNPYHLQYWWNLDDTEIRIEVLTNIIKQLEHEISRT